MGRKEIFSVPVHQFLSLFLGNFRGIKCIGMPNFQQNISCQHMLWLINRKRTITPKIKKKWVMKEKWLFCYKWYTVMVLSICRYKFLHICKLFVPCAKCVFGRYEFQMQYGSISWSIGAKLGYAQAMPEKHVISFIGDGSFQVQIQGFFFLIM